MAGKKIAINGKVGFAPPMSPWIYDDKGYLIASQSMQGGGAITFFPASGWDDALTAAAGGGQSSALELNYRNSRITTVATAADSVVLPVAQPGMQMTVVNADAADALAIFPASGDAINALAADASISVAANKTITFYCVKAGLWHSNLTA